MKSIRYKIQSIPKIEDYIDWTLHLKTIIKTLNEGGLDEVYFDIHIKIQDLLYDQP